MPHTRLRTMAIVGFLLLAIAACGGDDEGATTTSEGVASLQDQGDGGISTTAAPRLSFEEAALEFTACLRDAGIEVPDVQFGPNGQPLLDPGSLQGLDVGSTEFQSAFAGCLPIIQNAGVLERELDPEQEALVQDRLQEFAQCMRDNGVPDFPDPDPSSSISFPLSAFADFQSEDFQSALEVCQRITADLDFGAGDG